MSQNAAEAQPMSWESDIADGDDFELSTEAAEVPLACSIDNPECEACQ